MLIQIRIQVLNIFLRLLICKTIFFFFLAYLNAKTIFSFFLALFYAEPFRDKEVFIYPLIVNIAICVLEVTFFLSCLVYFLFLGSVSMYPHIFADVDPDSGSLNVVNSTNPDPDI